MARLAMLPIVKIISGGQTGVDRAALDVAIELQIPCGGWCPRGRRAEDGTIPDRYALQPTRSAEYAERTERNVVDADGTLIIATRPLTGGTALTVELAHRWNKPCFIVDLQDTPDVDTIATWLRHQQIETLNIAGPRESRHPGIHEKARQFLRNLFRNT
ncbi:MAG: putative molybdenum carrier protein [Gammaproteobacteria bacterium]|nr:putative molybdenum carrier protein [Gammaproteobacteria bacterium]